MKGQIELQIGVMFAELEKTKGDIMGAGMILWKQILKDTLKVGLIQGRHPLPVEGYIFGPLPDEGSLKDKIPQLQNKAEEWLSDKGIGRDIDLYVTGMTPVLTAFLKAWNIHKRPPPNFEVDSTVGTLTLYHYDLSNKTYWAEEWR